MEAPPDDDPLALLGIDLDSCPDVGSIASGSRRGRKRKLPHLASLVDGLVRKAKVYLSRKLGESLNWSNWQQLGKPKGLNET